MQIESAPSEVRELIKKLGGSVALAEAINLTADTTRYWAKIGRIPFCHRELLITLRPDLREEIECAIPRKHGGLVPVARRSKQLLFRDECPSCGAALLREKRKLGRKCRTCASKAAAAIASQAAAQAKAAKAKLEPPKLCDKHGDELFESACPDCGVVRHVVRRSVGGRCRSCGQLARQSRMKHLVPANQSAPVTPVPTWCSCLEPFAWGNHTNREKTC